MKIRTQNLKKQHIRGIWMYLDHGYFISDETIANNDITLFNIQTFFCHCGSDKQIYFSCAKLTNDFFLFIL